MYFSVDRFEGDKAILIDEGGKPLEVPRSLLPEGTKQGDMLYYGTGGKAGAHSSKGKGKAQPQGGRFLPAPDKTKERRKRVAGVLGQLLRHGDEKE